ncbi:MAG: DNA repair protein RecO [Candidatus Saelkia tenebricola]|nr:DNA repair protein RecO [Candidatus Saelkia tenebricola]
MIEKTKGFIIKRKVYRDTSLLLTVYSYDFGKIEGIVKGVRKIEDYGRYDGIIDLFSNYEVVFYPRKSKFALFVQFYLIESYWNIIKKYDNFSTVCSGIELLNYMTQPYENNTDIYNLLMFFLNESSSRERDVIFYAFIVKLLKFTGFSPQINKCFKCQNKIQYRGYFSVREGVLVCPKCSFKENDLVPISSGMIKSINFLERESYDNIKRLVLTRQVKEELGKVISEFVSYHISFVPRSWQANKIGVG